MLTVKGGKPLTVNGGIPLTVNGGKPLTVTKGGYPHNGIDSKQLDGSSSNEQNNGST